MSDTPPSNQSPTLDLAGFLEHNVEGYLFSDLRVMQGVSVPEGAHGGGLGYPLLMTASAGIELLGALLSPAPFNTRKGDEYFRDYWQRFLYPDAQTNPSDIEVTYQLARHGVAHMFLLKGRVGVIKGQPEYHLAHGPAGEFYIDATQLANDLIKSYERLVKPALSDPTEAVNAATMTRRLQEIYACYSSQAERALNGGNATASAWPHSSPTGEGPSGPWGPVPSTVSTTQVTIMGDITKLFD